MTGPIDRSNADRKTDDGLIIIDDGLDNVDEDLPTQVGAVVDVRIAFGANANAGGLRDMTDVVKDGLRAGGDTVICYHLEKTSQLRHEIPTPATRQCGAVVDTIRAVRTPALHAEVAGSQGRDSRM
ncbi:MAG TPA: hypothetical protein VEO54_05345 [Thermoanaerobaculia bacterium]|nr:hypothetical protein [Thermoanaerobaculia bacterium]